jgi:RNA polymerase sigma-70 factor (ECF subfamily)
MVDDGDLLRRLGGGGRPEDGFDDEVLLWGLACAPRRALECIYRKYYDQLLTVAMGLVNDENTADDIVQEVFVKFVESTNGFDAARNLNGYLVMCVVNRARLWFRRNGRQAKTPRPAPGEERNDPHRVVVAAEDGMRVNSALAQLPYEQRETVILHAKCDMTFREIATSQEVSVSTASRRYRSGLKKLKSILGGDADQS